MIVKLCVKYNYIDSYHRDKAGFIKSELVGSLGSRLNERNAKNFERLQEKRKGILSFDDFMVLCSRLDVKPIIVLNLYTGSPSESAEWVRYVKEKGYKVFGWELGNKLYLPFFKNKIRDGDGKAFPQLAAFVEKNSLNHVKFLGVKRAGN